MNKQPFFTCFHVFTFTLCVSFSSFLFFFLFFIFYSLRCYSKIRTSFNNSCQNIQRARDYRNRSLKNEHLFCTFQKKKKKKARQRTNEYSGCRKRAIKCDAQMKTNPSTFPFRSGIALSKLISHDRTVSCENGQEWNETVPPDVHHCSRCTSGTTERLLTINNTGDRR